jgi:Mrp family chromosome partitioning ATPase/capsular polysaccharide biosynthesis protein
MGNPDVRLASLVRRWWLTVLIATVGGAVVGYVVGSRVSPTFAATTQVLLEGPSALSPTYAELVKSTPVLGRALRSTGSDLSIADLRDNVRGESDQNTRLVTIEVDARNRREAIQLAIELVDPAKSAARVRPLTSLLLFFGGAVGFLGAVAFVLIAESRNPTIATDGELGEAMGVPVLGSVNGGLLGAGAVSFDPVGDPDESIAYRRLATQIAVANQSDAPNSLVIVGADRAEGSRTVAVRLAHALALEGRKVVLADFEGDGIKRYLRIGERGVDQVMRRVEPVKHASLVVDRFALRSGAPLVLATGRSDALGLDSETVQELVDLMSAEADVLIVHAPPPSSSRAALTWARATDATILVVRGEKTKQEQVAEALAGLESVRTKLVGAVLQR